MRTTVLTPGGQFLAELFQRVCSCGTFLCGFELAQHSLCAFVGWSLDSHQNCDKKMNTTHWSTEGRFSSIILFQVNGVKQVQHKNGKGRLTCCCLMFFSFWTTWHLPAGITTSLLLMYCTSESGFDLVQQDTTGSVDCLQKPPCTLPESNRRSKGQRKLLKSAIVSLTADPLQWRFTRPSVLVSINEGNHSKPINCRSLPSKENDVASSGNKRTERAKNNSLGYTRLRWT